LDIFASEEKEVCKKKATIFFPKWWLYIKASNYLTKGTSKDIQFRRVGKGNK
jgi:hypothetical protein